jgi:RNA polymerase sigma factor (sigma-70 family)
MFWDDRRESSPFANAAGSAESIVTMAAETELIPVLERVRDPLNAYLQREARGLLLRESLDDVVQGVHLRALRQAEQLEIRSDGEFFNWLKIVARQHVLDRQKYWGALRRQGGAMLRITSSPASSESGGRGIDLAGTNTGPATYAMRREMLELAANAIKTLLPRDQELVRYTTDSMPIDQIAKLLGVSYDAAEQARRRALERFRKAYELLTRGSN